MNFDTEPLAPWINGFLVLATISSLLAVTAMVLLLLRGRTVRGPLEPATRMPEITPAHPRATVTDRAA